ncbi:HNH endonuclease family protein [Pseudomonas monteilii]|uniref:HNH endonuclease family protein n=2 Tax=Pseudomonas TaxID=286 RepID=UPI001E60D59D|nr:HNH endonuclease family protein [Pseudomonas monteilii]MCE1010337.1 HNH endonuclease family protein [Pseudomonas monteilii]
MALIFEHVEGGTRDEAVSEMQDVWRGIYRSLEDSTRIGDEALRFAGAWASDTRPNRIPSEADSTALLTLKAGTQLRTIAEVGHELEAVVQANLRLFRDPRLRAVTRIVHARFVAAAILLRKFDKETEKKLLGKWERATFRIYELAGRDSRHKVGEYIRLGYEIYRSNLDKDQILSGLEKLSKGYSIDEVLNNIDWVSSYEGWQNQLRYVLNRYDEHLAKLAGQKLNESQWGKIWEQDAANSIEHIAPQSSGVEWMHHLGNLTMLPPGTNSSLKAKPPVEKLDVYRSCGLIGTIHVGHQIHDAGSWTEEMVLARAKSIEDFIRLEWAD